MGVSRTMGSSVPILHSNHSSWKGITHTHTRTHRATTVTRPRVHCNSWAGRELSSSSAVAALTKCVFLMHRLVVIIFHRWTEKWFFKRSLEGNSACRNTVLSYTVLDPLDRDVRTPVTSSLEHVRSSAVKADLLRYCTYGTVQLWRHSAVQHFK